MNNKRETIKDLIGSILIISCLLWICIGIIIGEL